MRIMHVSPLDSLPSFEKTVKNQRKTTEVVKVVLKPDGSPYRVEESGLNIAINGVTPVSDQQYDQKLRKTFDALFKKYQPDIVHIHVSAGFSVLPILNTASSLRIRKIVSLDDASFINSSADVRKRIKCAIDQTDLIVCRLDRQRKFLETVFPKNEKIITAENFDADADKYYRELKDREGRNLFFKVGHLCNSACLYCVAGVANEPFIDLTLIKKELEQKAAQYDCIIFTGGEPTMHPRFFELLWLVYYLGYKIEIQSNIRLFSSKRFTARAKKFNIKIIVCMNSSREDVFDLMADAKGAFKQTVLGARNLTTAGMEVDTKVIITNYNYDHLSEILDFIKGFGINSSMLVFPTPMGLAQRNFKQINPRYAEVMPSVHEALQWGIDNNMHLTTENFPGCMLEDRFHKCSTDITNECALDGIYLNISRGLYSAKSVRENEQKQRVRGCEHCQYSYKCEGVYREYVRSFGEEEFNPTMTSV